MNMMSAPAAAKLWDVIVIGGGFYGSEIALHFSRLGHKKILLLEREGGLLQRASYVNQARVHNGYHYPRSLVTAVRSHANFERFVDEYRYAIVERMEKLYAIAKGSQVGAAQFQRFCATVGIPCLPAPTQLRRYFDANLIDEVFATRELAFNSALLSQRISRSLEQARVEVRLRTEAQVVETSASEITVQAGGAAERGRYVINCTYAQLAYVGIRLKARIKREMTEMALIRPPSAFLRVGVTVMDGPFFSIMPFPAEGLHTLSHVRYTPHFALGETPEQGLPSRSTANAMVRDASHYLPCLASSVVVRPIFDIKAVLARNEDDDGRPILIERSEDNPRLFSVLGAKIDNIFDIQDYISAQRWDA